jgi:long-chain acyl-CoA synthetase
VAFTAAQLAADVDNIVATMGLRRDWPNLVAISMAHSYGFSNLVLPLLLHGVPLLIAPSPLPEVIRRAAEDWPALTLPGVPALWRAWHEADAIPASVRLAISAGALLPATLEQAVFDRSGLKIHNFYGASECGGIAYDRSKEPRQDDTCVGTAMENVKLSIKKTGCLQVRGSAVGETYWPEPDKKLRDGVFQTSDVAEIRDLVCLRGRTSDLINVAGRKVMPEIIERVLRQHPAVRECLVLGLPDRGGQCGETIAAVVVAPGSSPEKLREFLLAQLPAWQAPREWRFVDSLGVNRRGKISRTEWRHGFSVSRSHCEE